MLRVRWLGQVPFEEAHTLQRALHDHGRDDYLLMLEHPHVVTLGLRGDMSHVLVDPETLGAKVLRTDRGGDVTYHGPGQLVAYPVVSVAMGPGAIPSYVSKVEQIVIDTLADFGLDAGRLCGFPGVWVDPSGSSPRKICAVGIRVSRGRSMHGLALNVNPDMKWFSRIVPCGISEMGVTSLAQEGIDCSMQEVVEALAARAIKTWAASGDFEGQSEGDLEGRFEGDLEGRFEGDLERQFERQFERQDVASFRAKSVPESVEPRVPGSGVRIRLRQVGIDPERGVAINERKPAWLRAPVVMGGEYRSLGRTMRDLDLVTVCEEAGCPNIYECWSEGTATFMINGDRCTRACGFCLVDTRRPLPADPEEPNRVAEAVSRMKLAHAVVTAVARDDLADGGAAGFAATVTAIRQRCPGTSVELLVPDCKGDAEALDIIFSARPDVLNHNLETVARLQRAVRPSAGYARSLAVLARAHKAGLVTKSGMILGMGETLDEVRGALADLRSVGVAIVTLGQYLRPSTIHTPVARYLRPEEFEQLGNYARSLGFEHVESSPLTRSSYHARRAMESATASLTGSATGPATGSAAESAKVTA